MLASSGEITEPCPVPLSLTVTVPSSRTPAFSHLRRRRMMRGSPIRCSTKRTSQSWQTVSKKDRMSASRMKFTLRLVMPTARASSASCGPRPGRACPPGRRSPAAAASVRLRDVDPAGRLGPVGPAVDAAVQIHEPAPEIGLVLLPRHPIHPRCHPALERVERHLEGLGADVVQERGEPSLPPVPRGLSHAVQRLGHACPDLWPERASLARVPLGPRPALHRLRRRSPGFVRRLRRYYGGV